MSLIFVYKVVIGLQILGTGPKSVSFRKVLSFGLLSQSSFKSTVCFNDMLSLNLKITLCSQKFATGLRIWIWLGFEVADSLSKK